MILNGRDTGGELFEEHLATHGFVMVEVHSPDFYGNWDFGLIDHPRDMLFTLDQIASNPPDGLKGVIDSDHVGVSGYSSEGYNALALSGARIDPDFYQSQCSNADPGDPVPESWWIDYICNLAERWDAFVNIA
jgi:predicted dienelactone hydrolase